MTKTQYELDINAPVDKVYNYYTDPENIKDAWPQDIVKESKPLSSEKNEEGSQMKVKGEYMGREQEMTLEVTDKEQNRKLVTRQIQGPFKHWESIQEFQGDNNMTHVRHIVDYELPTTGKVASMLTGGQADHKIKQGMEQAAQTVKQHLESRTTV
jgi:ligand-binding SRPBCC domain-containing protein